MRKTTGVRLATIGLGWILLTSVIHAEEGGQGHRGRGSSGRGRGGDPAFVEDRKIFHQLLQHRDSIRREVKNTEYGVETITESDDPKVASLIQLHVASMKRRVEERRPIHQRDPLFAALFQHADEIQFTFERTAKGVRVKETSEDPYVATLIQGHARVVSWFIERGPDEVHRNHEAPAKKKEANP
ncbi:MAG: hypothetical protein U1D30_10535 [Planctomycetota bacterium]